MDTPFWTRHNLEIHDGDGEVIITVADCPHAQQISAVTVKAPELLKNLGWAVELLEQAIGDGTIKVGPPMHDQCDLISATNLLDEIIELSKTD